MNSLTKLINAAGFFQLIPCRQKCRKISCQAGRFAGNIYNMVYPIRKNLRQCFGMDSIPWRIQNDHIRFLRQIIQDFKDISCNKFAITQVIQCCILFCSFYCLFHNFHTYHFVRYGGCKLGDRSGSAVKVEHYFILRISDILTYDRIKHFRSQGIRLEK